MYSIENGTGDSSGMAESLEAARKAAQREAENVQEVRYVVAPDGESEPVYPSSWVTVEYMPEQHRSSHRAAGNWGTYPQNGAQRERMPHGTASYIVESDPDGYARIVGAAS